MIKRIIAVLLLAAVLVCGCAVAAEEGYGSLSVTVLDQNGASLSNAVVTITSGDKTITKSLNTPLEGDGKVQFDSLPVGIYSIVTSKAGYLTDSRTKEVVTDGTVYEAVRLQMENPIMIEVISASTKKPIENAQVTVNGIAYVTDKDGRVSAVMTKNGYNTLDIKANSYVDYHDDAKYISETDTAFQVPLTLAQVTPTVQVYNVDKVPVANAIVSIDGKQVAVSNSYGNAQMPTYTAGITHKMTIVRSGYAAYAQDITFTTDTTNYIVTLVYAETPVIVSVGTADKPLANAIVYFDGVNVGKTGTDGNFTTAVNPGKTMTVSASLDGYTGKPVNCTVEGNTENYVVILMTENVPTTAIALGVLGGILVLLIVILVIVWRRRGGRKDGGNKQSYPPSPRRDSL